MDIQKMIKKDPLYKAIFGASPVRKKRTTANRNRLTVSEKRIVNAVSRRVKSPVRRPIAMVARPRSSRAFGSRLRY